MHFIVKHYATASEIEEGKLYAESAGYKIDLSGDSPNFSIDVEAKTVYMNGETGTRLYSLASFKKTIDDNPVAQADPASNFVKEGAFSEPTVAEDIPEFDVDEPEAEDLDVESMNADIGGASTFVEEGAFSVATSLSPVNVTRTDYLITVAIG